MASGLNLFWATSSAGYGCYSYTRNNNKDQQNQYPKQFRPKPEVRLPQRRWGETYHANKVPGGTLGSKYNRIFLENCQRLFGSVRQIRTLPDSLRWLGVGLDLCLGVFPVIGIRRNGCRKSTSSKDV